MEHVILFLYATITSATTTMNNNVGCWCSMQFEPFSFFDLKLND